jgi:septum formation protein
MSPPQRIYLASRSPRRRELLHQIGVPYDTLLFRSGNRFDVEVDEAPLPGESPEAYVDRVARSKAICGLKLVASRHLRPNLVLSADTTLEVDGAIIGKPVDAPDAVVILKRLSARTHRVLTAVAVANPDGRIDALTSISEVRFKSLAEDEIRRYVATGESLDKAGAYGIQGHAGRFVEHLSGSYTGVMGLPLYETAELLVRCGFRF